MASIIGLIGIGYVNRIMLSYDNWPAMLGRSPSLSDFSKSLRPNHSNSHTFSYGHVFRSITPALREPGAKGSGRGTTNKCESTTYDAPD